MRALVALAPAVLFAAGHAGAEEQFRLLDAKQIQPRLIGRDLTDGVHWT